MNIGDVCFLVPDTGEETLDPVHWRYHVAEINGISESGWHHHDYLGEIAKPPSGGTTVFLPETTSITIPQMRGILALMERMDAAAMLKEDPAI